MKTRSQRRGRNKAIPTESSAILVVEDDADLLWSLEEHLRAEGFTVVGASSAAKAIAELKRKPVSLVLLDWDLSKGRTHPMEPGTGSVVLETCREWDPLVPVIVMSGHQATEVRTDAVMAEADSFLSKPFSLTLLADHLRHWLDRTGASRSLWKLTCEADILPFEQMKRRYVAEVVRLLGGNVAEAARRLKLHRHTVAALITGRQERLPGSRSQISRIGL